MNKERLGSASTPEEAGETAPDKKPMSETEMLQLMAEKTECSYSATRYRTIHPDTVKPSEIAGMNDEEFNDFLEAICLVEDYRAIPRSSRPPSRIE